MILDLGERYRVDSREVIGWSPWLSVGERKRLLVDCIYTTMPPQGVAILRGGLLMPCYISDEDFDNRWDHALYMDGKVSISASQRRIAELEQEGKDQARMIRQLTDRIREASGG